jgi:hypothetical protein
VLTGSVIGGAGHCVAHSTPVEPVPVEVMPVEEHEAERGRMLDQIAQDLDSEYKRQASGQTPSDDYQTGFDAGIREVKKILAHPNYREKLLAASTQPNPTGDREQLQELEWIEGERAKLLHGPGSTPAQRARYFTLNDVLDRIRDEQKAGR